MAKIRHEREGGMKKKEHASFYGLPKVGYKSHAKQCGMDEMLEQQLVIGILTPTSSSFARDPNISLSITSTLCIC